MTKRMTVVVPLIVLLAGCAVQSLTRRGDAALADGRPEAALGFYEKALARQPALETDPVFGPNLTLARRDAAMVRAGRFADKGEWDEAVAQYQLCLRVAPAHDPAVRGLAETRVAAAEDLYARAASAADDGDEAGSRALLKKAQVFSIDHAPARRALKNLDAPTAHESVDVVAAYRYAMVRMDRNEWEEARESLREAIASAPAHFPSRLALAKVKTVLGKIGDRLDAAERHAGKGELDEALVLMDANLREYPEHRTSRRLADTWRARRANALELAALAETELEAGRFEQAVVTVRQARAQFGASSAIQQLQTRCVTAAAERFLAQGREWLTQKEYASAAERFRRAGEFPAYVAKADAALADLELARGRQALGKGLAGHGLLFMRRARAHRQSAVSKEDVQRLESALQEADPLGFRLEVRGRDAATNAVAGGIAAGLRRTLPVTDRGDAYALMLRLERLEVDTEVVEQRSRSHRYVEEERVPNPEIPKAEAVVHAKAREEALRRRAMIAAKGIYEHARQRVDPNLPDQKQRLDHLYAELQLAERNWRIAERDHERARHDLERMPATVIVEHDRTWPYVAATAEKSGRLGGQYILSDGGGVRVAADGVQTTCSERDSYIENPNPRVGLREDPLRLPADRKIRDRLATDLQKRVAVAASKAAVSDHVASLRRRALALPAEAPQRRELSVTAALFLRQLNRRAAEDELGALAAELDLAAP